MKKQIKLNKNFLDFIPKNERYKTCLTQIDHCIVCKINGKQKLINFWPQLWWTHKSYYSKFRSHDWWIQRRWPWNTDYGHGKLQQGPEVRCLFQQRPSLKPVCQFARLCRPAKAQSWSTIWSEAQGLSAHYGLGLLMHFASPDRLLIEGCRAISWVSLRPRTPGLGASVQRFIMI